MPEVEAGQILKGRGVEPGRDVPCLLGVSVDGRIDWPRRAEAGWAWITERFDRTAILVGDSLQRITIELTEGLEPEVAARLAAERGAAAVDALERLRPSPLLIRTTAVSEDPRFTTAIDRFCRLYSDQAMFRAAIEKDARAYCLRQERRGTLRRPLEEAMARSAAYLLEEVAIYEILAQEGWKTEAYFGSELSILAEIMKGRLEGISDLLERRAHISLKLRTEG